MPTSPLRGELLYANHCITCHTSQIHWREQRLVHDWGSLLAQVRRWQGNAQLAWSEADIVEVARHLNRTYYKFKGGAVGTIERPGASPKIASAAPQLPN